MTDYSALTVKWATLTGTTDQKLAAINALMVQLPPMKAIVTPSQIINACEYKALSNVIAKSPQQLSLLLTGSNVDVSVGSTIRQGLQTLFSGYSATLNNLSALFKPFDAPQAPWWQTPIAQGGGGLSKPVSSTDLVNAGGLV